MVRPLATLLVSKGAVPALRRELIQRVAAANLHLRASDVEKVVRTVFEEIVSAMARNEAVDGAGPLSLRGLRQSGREIRIERICTERASAGQMHDSPPFVANRDLNDVVEVEGDGLRCLAQTHFSL